MCTFPPESAPQIHIERIYPDNQLWQICVEKSTRFFRTCLLPELLGRWNSRGPSREITTGNTETSNSTNLATTSSGNSNSDSVQLLAATDDSHVSTIISEPASSSSSSYDVHRYCYCQQPEGSEEMIGCDNPSCSIEWFHTSCLKLKRVPKGKWYCPDCRILP